MSGSIAFLVNNSTLEITLTLTPTSIPKVMYVSIENKSPLNVLNDVQTVLLYEFLFEGGKTLDQLVDDLIVKMGERKFSKSSISSIKQTAKDYYRIWINKNKSGLTNTDADYNRQTASIIIDMLSWWFIRRLVHVYVVCAILEGVYTTTQSYDVGVSKSYSSIPEYTLDTRNDEVESLKQKYNTNVSALQMDKSQLAQDLQSLLANYTKLEKDYQTHYAEKIAKEQEVKQLTGQLKEFKELLLHSTSMIFKIEEVPNMVKYG